MCRAGDVLSVVRAVTGVTGPDFSLPPEKSGPLRSVRRLFSVAAWMIPHRPPLAPTVAIAACIAGPYTATSTALTVPIAAPETATARFLRTLSISD